MPLAAELLRLLGVAQQVGVVAGLLRLLVPVAAAALTNGTPLRRRLLPSLVPEAGSVVANELRRLAVRVGLRARLARSAAEVDLA